MANITGIKGFNRSGSAVNKLFAAYGNDIVDVSAGTGFPLNLTAGNNVEFDVFLDRIFFQNNSERPKSSDGTTWDFTYLGRTMISKYIKNFKEKARLAVGNCKFSPPQVPLDSGNNAITFPSRVFMSDTFIGNNLPWGVDWGTNGKTYIGTPIFECANPIVQDFKANNIKVGDPLFITNGNADLISKPYYVQNVDSHNRVSVTENFPVTATGLHFWIGGNWFDVGTDDNDQITGFGDNSSRLLIFKLMSLWFYTGNQFKQVKDSLGTSSGRSVINYKGYTYYFHGSDPKISGIYRYNGVSSEIISRAIDPFIQGMVTTNYPLVVGWREGEELRFYIGNLTNTNYNISMTNAVATLNTVTGAWDVSPISDVITCATTFRTSNREDTYCGTSDDEVLQMADGNSFNTAPISLVLETKPYYPVGSDIINTFTRIQVIGRQTKGVRVRYKLWDNPNRVDDYWRSLGELSNDRTELPFYDDNVASGIQLRFEDIGTVENDLYIEKITVFHKPETLRV